MKLPLIEMRDNCTVSFPANGSSVWLREKSQNIKVIRSHLAAVSCQLYPTDMFEGIFSPCFMLLFFRCHIFFLSKHFGMESSGF